MINLTRYYSLYNRFKTGKVICWGIGAAKLLGIRHLLVRMDTNFCCNLKCRTCYFSADYAKKFTLPPMKLDLFKTIARDVFPKARILYLSCGGEPFMTKNFENFLEETGRHSVPFVGYVTNALLLTEDIVQAGIKNKVSEITVSIDGATKNTYERIRTGGNFDTLLSKLTLYKDTAAKIQGHKPLLRFNYTVTRSNHLEMPALVTLAKQFGINTVKFRIFSDWGGDQDFARETLIDCKESFNRSLLEAKRLAQEANIQVIAPAEFTLNEEQLAHTTHADIDMNNVGKPPCLYPWFYRYIDPLGRVRVCANLPHSEIRIGDRYKLKDFESSPEEVKRKHLLKTNICDSCFTRVCNGGPLKRANDDVNFIE